MQEVGGLEEDEKHSQKIRLLAEDGERNFFKNCRNYQTKDCATPFNPRQLFPGLSDAEVAKELSLHFNEISREFSPLEPHQIPLNYRCPLKTLLPHEVAAWIKRFRKPKSMVKGMSSQIGYRNGRFFCYSAGVHL